MQRIKTLIIERQCESDDCNVGDRHEFHCLAHQEWDKKALAECRQSLKCPACNSQIHTYTKEVYRNVPYFNKDARPKTITVKSKPWKSSKSLMKRYAYTKIMLRTVATIPENNPPKTLRDKSLCL